MTETPTIPRHSFKYDGTIVTVYHADKGKGLPKHEHKYAHVTMCNAGSIIVRKEDKELIMTKDTQPVNLVAEEWHEIEALEDGTVFVNIYAEGKNQ
jgi:quercetin dioxygenase-like cupin family protein